MKKVIWAPNALVDLKEAYDYICLDNLARAKRMAEDIIDRVEKLSRFTKLGRVIVEIGESRYRELIIGNYRIIHEIRNNIILIFRAFHAKRMFPTAN